MMYNFYIISVPLKNFFSRILKFINFSKVIYLLNDRVMMPAFELHRSLQKCHPPF